jgi:hypothetical protein
MDSKQVNKVIKLELTPLLISNNFNRISDRRYIKITDNYYYGIEIKSVGKYFSDVTGWPSQTISSFGGLFCRLIKPRFELKNGLPEEGNYHFRVENICGLNQDFNTKKLTNLAERKRKDLWWIDDYSNLQNIISDLKESIVNNSINYFNKFIYGEDLIQNVEEMKDCFNKYWDAYYLYKSLNKESETNKYKIKLINESKRIGYKELTDL